MSTDELIKLLSIGSNLTVITIGVKIIRTFSRLELKVDTMWSWFTHKFDSGELK